MPPQAEEEFSIHWIDDVVSEVLERDTDEYLVSTGKSPSGSIHIGFMRELVIANVITRRLQDLGKNARMMFVVDDYDPIRSFPDGVSLPIDEWSGIPYSQIPDEFGCCESFGAHYANELIESFPDFGVDPDVVWTSKIYETEEMLDAVRTCLRHTETIREIMVEYVASDFDEEQRAEYLEAMKSWYPASVVCPKCGHLQSGTKGAIEPNRITDYDEEQDLVSFECQECGYSDTLPLDEVKVKLTWRVDWPAKWHIYDVTCEPAGKDHSVKGGSYDTGLEVSHRVFSEQGPVKVAYEWVRIGGRDMATSEGIVFTPKAWSEIAPPEVYRYLMLKTDLRRAINIEPERLPDLIDEYDRFERLYYGLEEGTEEEMEVAQLVYPLTQVHPVRDSYCPKLPFKFAKEVSQLEEFLGPEVVISRCKEAIKKQYDIDRVSEKAISQIQIRLQRANNWVNQFGSDRDKLKIRETVPDEFGAKLSSEERKFLEEMLNLLQRGPLEDEEIQSAVFENARDIGLKVGKAFGVFYKLLISRRHGPRLGPFINLLGREWVVERLEAVLKGN
jgi:lysyl-tRNA synthetase class 1